MRKAKEINWFYDFDEAAEASRETGKPLLIVFYGEDCLGCLSLFRETMRKPRVVEAVNASFTPLLTNADVNKPLVTSYGVDITPTFIAATVGWQEMHRWTGFLPEDDFISYLDMATALIAFKKRDFAAAERLLDQVLYRHPVSFVAPRAAYYLGITKYRMTGSQMWLARAHEYLKQAYPASVWTVKAGAWSERSLKAADRAA